MKTLKEFSFAFSQFENNARLFDKEIDSVFWWDGVRYDVYTYLLELNTGPAAARARKSTSRSASYAQKLFSIARLLSYLFIRIILLLKVRFSRARLLILRVARKVQDGQMVDENLDHLLPFIKEDKVIVDNFPRKYFSGRLFFARPARRLSDELWFQIESEADQRLVVPADFREFIEAKIAVFFYELSFYIRVLQRSNFSRIVLTQYGVERALLLAAKRLGITTIELQHGLITKYNPLYNYPHFAKGETYTTPDYFLVRSRFWAQQCNMPASEIISIGFPIQIRSDKPQAYDVTYISTSLHHDFLILEALDFAKQNPQLNIAFKLHPNESHRYTKALELARGIDNLSILDANVNSANCIDASAVVVGIRSSLLVNAMLLGKPVYIIRAFDYEVNDEFLSVGMMQLIASSQDILMQDSAFKKSTIAIEEPLNINSIEQLFGPAGKLSHGASAG